MLKILARPYKPWSSIKHEPRTSHLLSPGQFHVQNLAAYLHSRESTLGPLKNECRNVSKFARIFPCRKKADWVWLSWNFGLSKTASESTYDMIRGENKVLQAFLGTLMTWGITAAGAAVVFLFIVIKFNGVSFDTKACSIHIPAECDEIILFDVLEYHFFKLCFRENFLMLQLDWQEGYVMTAFLFKFQSLTQTFSSAKN